MRNLRSMQSMRRARHEQRGSTLVMAAVVVMVLVGISAGILTVGRTESAEHRHAEHRLQALYIAEAGVAQAIADLQGGGSGNLGSASAPLPFGGGTLDVTAAADASGTVALTSRGRRLGETRIVEAVVRQDAGVFGQAVFAGNASMDPFYEMRFGGTGVQADEIHGDVHSEQDLAVTGDALLDGKVQAYGSITGYEDGETGIHGEAPDIEAEDYEVEHDVDVAREIEQCGSYEWDDCGGEAWQLPESDPAHIFRKNPSDRDWDTSATEKDDYFLEDPYEPVGADYAQDGSDPFWFSLSGIGGKPGPEGNHLVYFIDGNLWIHNKHTYSLRLRSPLPEGVQVTFVVRGNVYMADNAFYGQSGRDGIAFLAIEDPAVADSGNIYFGDPVFGTLQVMESFLYAEHDFYDNHLDASGSADVELHGNMSAGNHVAIHRDSGGQHTKLILDGDDRIETGAVDLPGLPSPVGGVRYRVVSWRETLGGEMEP